MTDGVIAPLTCPSCGHAEEASARFCGVCGASLSTGGDELATNGGADLVACPSCGHREDPSARFCGECGASLSAPDSAAVVPAAPVEEEDEAADDVSELSSADANVEADDAWEPEAPTVVDTPIVVPVPVSVPVPPRPTAPPPPPVPADEHVAAPPPVDPAPAGPGGDRRRRRILLIALAVLLLGGGGAAAAALLTSGSSDKKTAPPPTVTVHAPPRTVTQQAPAATETSAVTPSVSTPSSVPSNPTTETDTLAAPASSTLLPAESSTQMTREIQSLLLQYHQDIVARQPAAAWKLLSSRKQRQELRKDGYTNWATAQLSLAPHLDPSGIRVQVLSKDAASGIVTVKVTGMKWSAPHARCTEWSGITWVKYENTLWKYDPGFATTAARKREWKSRYSQLLGAQCI